MLPTIDKRAKTELKGYSDILKQLLFNRGIVEKEKAHKFLNPDISQIHSSTLLSDINEAMEKIKNVKESGGKIFVYGDYDVDGVMATSILWDFLYRKLHIDTLPYIPSRFEEGYGLSRSGLDSILQNKGSLVITVDCGIRDIELVEEYTKKGLEFIITDHHTLVEDEDGDPVLSEDAVAVVHPKSPKSNYPFKEICGAAVAWKLIDAYSKKFEISQFDSYDYLDMVSIATITDIMPLEDENRAIVALGLKKIQNTQNLGLRTLMLSCGVDQNAVDAYHYGFVLGPRINAAGRMEDAMDAVRLFSTEKLAAATEFAEKLNSLNLKRQDLTKEIFEKAKLQAEKETDNNLIFVWGDKWPEGIVGLVAGKLQEEFYKPVLAASVDGEVAVGSARSISGFNITDAISRSAQILERFGGHAQAAGFTVRKENLENFKRNVIEYANEEISEENLVKTTIIDMELKLSDLTADLFEEIETLKPFGLSNRTPSFLLDNLEVMKKFFLGREKSHVKLLLKDQKGNQIDALGFFMAQKFEFVNPGDRMRIIGAIDKNEWNGQISIQIKIKEFELL